MILRDTDALAAARQLDLDVDGRGELDGPERRPCYCGDRWAVTREPDGRLTRSVQDRGCRCRFRLEDAESGIGLDLDCLTWEVLQVAIDERLGAQPLAATAARWFCRQVREQIEASADHPAVAYLAQQSPGVLDPVEESR